MSYMEARAEVPWERYRHTLGWQVGPARNRTKTAALWTQCANHLTTSTCVLGRVKGCTEIRESERLDKLAALGASLCLYLSARHVEKVQAILLQHYTPDTPVAIGYRVSWPDEWLRVVPLREIAEVSRQHQLVRTTLYIISPALAGTTSAQHSCVYDPDHNHLFRPRH